MNAPLLRLVPTRPETLPGEDFARGGLRAFIAALERSGRVDPGAVARAIALLPREDATLSEILLAQGAADPETIAEAQADAWRTTRLTCDAIDPDPTLVARFGPEFCAAEGFVPLKHLGMGLLVATARPERLSPLAEDDPKAFGRVFFCTATEADVSDAIARVAEPHLAHAAETRVEDQFSCRNWYAPGVTTAFLLSGLAAVSILFPVTTLLVVFLWALITLILTQALKLAAVVLHLRDRAQTGAPTAPPERLPTIAKLPKVSILVPLFKETAIAARLVKRLKKLDYPRELLDICLITESEDHATRAHLTDADLPPWMRVVTVPPGTVKTKPRALNYALSFCRGSIIGVYDAEDQPEPDQIHKVVRRFHERPAEVACLQGVLDYYNARTNWLSRCFTIEYATWFRLILPGLQRLGLVLPLGGTTLFFRRGALEKLGGWDAHNVTEDADLGIRLARFGYRTEMIDTVTREEANCRAVPWIKQRSRWLKGYALTWGVHMRRPDRLWAELGARRFLGVQLLFLGTLSQFVLAPILWSFGLVALGLPHPLDGVLSGTALLCIAGVFLATELLSATASAIALSPKSHRWLIPWVPTMMLYFPLGALASYKGLWEILCRPFYWDKTVHGVFQPRRAGDRNAET